MSHLYELTAAYSDLQNRLDDPDADEQQLTLWLDECSGALQEKCTDIAKVIGNLEATATAIADAEIRMNARRKAIENRIKSIKAYVLRNMQAADIHKIECPEFKISRQKNPASVIIDDEAAIAISYWRQPETPPPSIDKRAILDDIKNGVIVAGAHSEQTERLVIK